MQVKGERHRSRACLGAGNHLFGKRTRQNREAVSLRLSCLIRVGGVEGGDGSRHRPSRGGVLLAVPGSKIRPVRRRGCLDLERKKHICVLLLPAATEGEAVHEKRPRQRRGAASGGRQTCRLDGERGPHCRYSCRKSPIFFFFFSFFLLPKHSTQHRPASLDVSPPPTDCSMECAKED